MTNTPNTKVIKNRIHTWCKRCKRYQPSHSQEGLYFEGGITVKFIGGYAEYYDPMAVKDDDLVQINLCHECTVEVLKFVGVYEDERFKGGHPSHLDDTPCCDNCWIPYYVDGKWVGTKDPQGNITMHEEYHA